MLWIYCQEYDEQPRQNLIAVWFSNKDDVLNCDWIFVLFCVFPVQRSSGGLSIPLCAFQGTVSLQAPTGKTLSLSTYEVSSDGRKISPNNAKKVMGISALSLFKLTLQDRIYFLRSMALWEMLFAFVLRINTNMNRLPTPFLQDITCCDRQSL